MKNLFFALLLSLLFVSCNQENEGTNPVNLEKPAPKIEDCYCPQINQIDDFNWEAIFYDRKNIRYRVVFKLDSQEAWLEIRK